MAKVIHLVCELPADKPTQTRCGLVGVVSIGDATEQLLSEGGSLFDVSMEPGDVTCKKCRSLIGAGTTHPKPPEQETDKAQYERRSADWRKFLADGHYAERCNSMEISRLHDAFNAGWAARKQAEYETVLGIADKIGKHFR